ncbi:MAG TPA: peptidoglycan-binding domain-containing protein, partial [Candidatus Obscuribacterales bacterium]
GQIIKNLQYSLNLTVNAKLPVSEFYGPLTLRAMKTFQQTYGLPATGIANLTVRKKLDEEAKKRLPIAADFNASPEEALQQVV